MNRLLRKGDIVKLRTDPDRLGIITRSKGRLAEVIWQGRDKATTHRKDFLHWFDRRRRA